MKNGINKDDKKTKWRESFDILQIDMSKCMVSTIEVGGWVSDKNDNFLQWFHNFFCSGSTRCRMGRVGRSRLPERETHTLTPSERSHWHIVTRQDILFQICRYICHIVSVLHQNEGGIGKSIPDAQEISRGSREISRAEGMDFPIPPEFWWSMEFLFMFDLIPSDGSGNPSP